jgi:hypothetical protein
MLLRCLSIGLVMLQVACGPLLEPEEGVLPPRELPVQFESIPQTAAFHIQGAAGAVIVQDLAVTGPCPRREEHGAYRRGDVVTFWMAHIVLRGLECRLTAMSLPYRATILNVPAGTYTVRVEYIGQISSDRSPPSQNLEQQVTVH